MANFNQTENRMMGRLDNRYNPGAFQKSHMVRSVEMPLPDSGVRAKQQAQGELAREQKNIIPKKELTPEQKELKEKKLFAKSEIHKLNRRIRRMEFKVASTNIKEHKLSRQNQVAIFQARIKEIEDYMAKIQSVIDKG